MTPRSDQLVLAVLIGGVGNHIGAWRRPESRVEEKYSLDLFKDVVGWAEAAKLHAVFIADTLRLETDTLRTQPLAHLEPVTLLSALSAVTEHIGLIGSISTTFSEPFNVARQLASLDHLSGGRAGWNLVTSAWGEENFGRELPPHDERYERGAEFAEVLFELFDSWDDDALVLDRERGLYADPEKVRRIDHVGKHFDVRGPLNLARSPQGTPDRRPGRLLRDRAGRGGALRRRGVHHRSRGRRGRPRVLPVAQGAGGRARPQPRRRQDPAGRLSDHRRDGDRGARRSSVSSTASSTSMAGPRAARAPARRHIPRRPRARRADPARAAARGGARWRGGAPATASTAR